MSREDAQRSAGDVAAAAAGAAATRAFVETIRGRATNGTGPGRGRPSIWQSVRAQAIPIAEATCTALGRYLARRGPDLLRVRLLPKFVDGFADERRAAQGD